MTSWSIGEIHFSLKEFTAIITMYGYLNDERKANASTSPIMTKKITLSGANYWPDMTRADIYNQITSFGEFQGLIPVGTN